MKTTPKTDPQRELLDKLRAELHALYLLSERTGSTVMKMEQLSREIAEAQGTQEVTHE